MVAVTHRIPGLVLTDHTFQAPLDHAAPGGARIELFGRVVSAAGNEGKELPWLLFLQGGPGFAAPRPATNSGWIKRAVSEYHVLLLDPRGTGRSSPITAQTLASFPTPAAQAAYLLHFRADAIVQDAEWIRRALLGDAARWSVLGQSYGGFCATHYLSVAPAALDAVLITGGLPPLVAHPDEIYRATYRHVLAKNERYFARYPGDVTRVRAIVDVLATQEIHLPSGDRLTPQRFQQLGLELGASDGFERIHYLLEEAFVRGATGPELSLTFLRGIESLQAYDTNPIFAILHESIYCQHIASRWSAARVRDEYPAFEVCDGAPVYFTGEMIYPWMFDDYRYLRPLKAAAELLAAHESWPALYDTNALRTNAVPVAATVYYDDMYVDREFAMQTAASIRGCRVWITNEYEHNALRADGETIFSRLLEMVRGQR